MWTNICTDFDPDEETKNFGTRNALELGGKIFDVFTQATVSPRRTIEDEAVVKPWLTSCSRQSPERLALVLDNYLHIFDHALQDVFSIDLKVKISSLAWTDHESFLLVGLASGQAQFIHVASKTPLPPFEVMPSGEEIAGIRPADLIFASENGRLVKLDSKPLCLNDLHDALEKKDYSALQQLQRQINFMEVPHGNDEKIKDMNGDFISFESSVGLLTQSHDLIDVLDLVVNVQKMAVPQNGDVLVVLDDTGTLHMICKLTMMTITSWNCGKKILDMALMEDETDLKLIFITEHESNHSLLIYDFPRMTLVYELKVANYCKLLDNALGQENPLFIEGQHDESSKCLQMLRIRAICEGNTEARLVRLIARHKFKEAVQFAQLNGLCVQEVYRAQAVNLVNALACSEKRSEADIFQGLQETLKEIEDKDFVIHCCLNAAFANLNLTRKMLLIARENHDHDVTKVNLALHKLDTFIFVHGVDQDLQSWIVFAKVDILEEMKRVLSVGKLKQALVIWNRHHTDFDINLTTFESVLNALPASAQAKKEFLKVVIPDFLSLIGDPRELSEAVEYFAQWILMTTNSLETDCKSNWPQAGIDFAKEMLHAVEKVDQDDLRLSSARISLLIDSLKRREDSSLKKLVQLIDTLEDLQKVHTELRLRVKLSDFNVEDKKEAAHLLLDWCTEAEEMRHLLDKFLVAFMNKFAVDKDQALSQYIISLVEESDCCWYHNPNEKAPWQDRVIVLVSYIESCSLKIEAILASLAQAPAPWSPGIQSLAKMGRSLNDPRAESIDEQEKLVVVKQMVAKHQAGNHYRMRGREAERLLQRIFKARLDEEAFEDAVKVSKALEGVDETDAKFLYVDLLLCQDRHTEAVKVVTTEDVFIVSQRVLIKAEIEDATLSQILFLKAVLVMFPCESSTLVERIENVNKKFVLNSQDFQGLNVSQLLDHPVPVAVAKLHKYALLGGDYLSLLEDYSNQLEDKRQLIDIITDMNWSCMSLESLRNEAKVLSVIVNNEENESDLNDWVARSSWAHWREAIKSNNFDQTVFDQASDEQDMDMTAIQTKLQSHFIRDKGLPLDSNVAEMSLALQEKFSKFTFFEESADVTAFVNDANAINGAPTEQDLDDMIALIQDLYSQLMSKNHSLLALSMLNLLNWPLVTHEKIQEAMKNLHLELASTVLYKSLMESRPDLPFLSAFLSSQTKSTSGLGLLQQTRSNLRSNDKLVNLARLGARYCAKQGLLKEKDQFKQLLLSASWAQKLSMNPIDFCKLHFNEHRNVLTKMVSKNANVIDDLKKYCSAFGAMPTSSVMQLYIKETLSMPVKDLKMIDEAFEQIDPEEREVFLQAFIEEDLSWYDYESLDYVKKKIANEPDPILDFLKSYTRICKPSDDEIEQWLNSRSCPFPHENATQRLPFHSVDHARNSPKDMFNLLSNEFCIESCDRWLSSARVFKLGAINVRVMAAKNTITRLLSDVSYDQEFWHTKSLVPEDVLDKLITCLNGISDLIKANSAAFWIANRLPKGIDKLRVTRCWLEHASKWHQSAQDEASAKALDFAKQSQIKLEVENVLHENGIERKATYLSLIHQCKFDDLIHALFELEFEQKNVNRAASQIALVIDDEQIVDLTLIKYRLLDKWLPEVTVNCDETLNLFNGQALEKCDESASDYWRCLCIVRGLAQEEEADACDYLVQVAFSEEPKWTTNHKLRALKCLLTVMGSQKLEECLDKSVPELEARFHSLVLVSRLEKLNLPFHSVVAIEATDKMSLIETIFRSCGHLVDGVALVVDLCLQYGLYRAPFWSKLLTRLLSMGGQEDILRHTLLSMNKVPSLWHCPQFLEAWKKLTFQPFYTAAQPPTAQCRAACVKALKFLQTCPVVSQVGLDQLLQECHKLELRDAIGILDQISRTIETIQQ